MTKQNLFLLVSLLTGVILIGKIIGINDEVTAKPGVTNDRKASSVDGAWELVWAKYNDKLADITKQPQFKMFSNGVFSLIARDSTGKISFAGYGKFEIKGKNYNETFMYHNNPEYIGAMDWQDIEVRGDTLYAKGFSRVVIGGREVTDFPKIEEKRVRVKW